MVNPTNQDATTRSRIAWFSPLPPTRSGISAYSVEVLPALQSAFVIDAYPENAAHDFVWRARQQPYDLVVYHLGNAACHDYMWGYLARYPGLVVLHDARLHHARARGLLDRERFDEYRDEFRYDHPDVNAEVTQYAVEGLGGPIYYLWPMLRVVMDTARAVAVHSPWTAVDLREAFPHTPIETIRMGVPAGTAAPGARAAIRAGLRIADDAIVFAVFGKVTAEKRIAAILTALAALAQEGQPVHAMLVGDAHGFPLSEEITRRGLGDRVSVTGYVADDAVADHLAAADVCLCLRWPTALETSASWLRCLAAGRPTVMTDLAHLADIPADVAVRVSLADEARSLLNAMRGLAANEQFRRSLGAAGHAYWRRAHTLEVMAEDYVRLLPSAAMRPVPQATRLPRHFLADYSEPARETARRFGVSIDVLG